MSSPMEIDQSNQLNLNQQQTQDNERKIWGTNLTVNQIQNQINNFLTQFPTPQNAKYLCQLQDMEDTQNGVLKISGVDICQYNEQLYQWIKSFPNDCIAIFDQVANSLFHQITNYRFEQFEVEVVITNLNEIKRMRDFDTSDIEKLICIQGLVTRCSEIVPVMQKATFQCSVCQCIEQVPLARKKIEEPESCAQCQTKRSLTLLHNRSEFKDKQHIKLQEAPENIPEGETPQCVSLCAYGFLVNAVKPGDSVNVIGILRAHGIRQSAKKRVLKTIYKSYIDVIWFETQNNKEISIEASEIEEFKRLSQNPEIYNILVNSFAPSIYQCDDIKKGLLCQLFGGVSKDQQNRKMRGEINILLIGDPSTAKSQLLQYSHHTSPRGIYTSGKGSSAVGLTAYVKRDAETGDFVLEAGALVLSDQGICCIDEFDKMTQSTRAILHEVMEQQTISLAKAGIICQINARTAILAGANPKNSRYDNKLSVIENIKLNPTILSRFDLIYLVLDKINQAQDTQLALHILNMYIDQNSEVVEQPSVKLSKIQLRKYIKYARENCLPKQTEESKQQLITEYLQMRGAGISRNTITATTRQLNSLIRLSEAWAKMRLSEIVTKQDVIQASQLIKIATQQAATDPQTGCVDMGLINTGISAHARKKIQDVIKRIQDLRPESMSFQQIQQSFQENTEAELKEALNIMYNQGLVQLSGSKASPIVTLVSF